MTFDFKHNTNAKAECIWGGILLGLTGLGEIIYFAVADNPKVWPSVLIGVVGTIGLGLLIHGLASAYKRDASGYRDILLDDEQLKIEATSP